MKIVSFILADGSTLRAGHLNLDSSNVESVVRRGLAADTKTLGVNLYNASDAPFCLGSKTYRSADEAEAHASTRKGNYFSSFEVKYNAAARTMSLVDGDDGAPTYRRYALFNGTTFDKPSYASLDAARRANYGGKLIVEIGVRGTEVVSLRVVG